MYYKSENYLQEKGIKHSGFRSKMVSRSMLEESDLIIVLENYMKNDLLEMMDGKRDLLRPKILTLKETVGESGDIEDPYGMRTNHYNKILNLIEKLCKQLVSQWEEAIAKN